MNRKPVPPGQLKRLPDAELEVMKAVWGCGPGASRGQLGERLEHFHWSPTTINTYLARLEEKEFLEVAHSGRGNRYTARISREDYLSFDSRAVVSRLYGSPRNFVAALARDGLKEGELEDLRRLLDDLKDGAAGE